MHTRRAVKTATWQIYTMTQWQWFWDHNIIFWAKLTLCSLERQIEVDNRHFKHCKVYAGRAARFVVPSTTFLIIFVYCLQKDAKDTKKEVKKEEAKKEVKKEEAKKKESSSEESSSEEESSDEEDAKDAKKTEAKKEVKKVRNSICICLNAVVFCTGRA